MKHDALKWLFLTGSMAVILFAPIIGETAATLEFNPAATILTGASATYSVKCSGDPSNSYDLSISASPAGYGTFTPLIRTGLKCNSSSTTFNFKAGAFPGIITITITGTGASSPTVSKNVEIISNATPTPAPTVAPTATPMPTATPIAATPTPEPTTIPTLPPTGTCANLATYDFPTATRPAEWVGGQIIKQGSPPRGLRIMKNAGGDFRVATLTLNLGTAPEVIMSFLMRSNMLATVPALAISCGSSTSSLQPLATFNGTKVGRKVPYVSRIVSLTPAACGISGMTLGTVVIQFQNLNLKTLYVLLDAFKFITCPNLTFVDADTDSSISGLNLNKGDSKNIKICLSSGNAPQAISVTLSHSISGISIDDTILTIPQGEKCSSITEISSNSDSASGTVTASATGYVDATLNVSPGLVFKDGNTILTSFDLNETGGNQTLSVCLPDRANGATTITLVKETGDDRITIPASVTVQDNQTCADVVIQVNNDSIPNEEDQVEISASATVGTMSYDGDLTLNLTDDEGGTGGGTGVWSWKWDEPMQMTPNGVVNGTIQTAGGKRWQVFNDPSFCVAKNPSIPSGDYAGAEVANIYIGQPPATTATTQSIQWGTTETAPAEVPVVAVFPATIPADKIGKRVCLCVKNQEISDATATVCKSTPIITPAANFYHPSFFMTASYDWMHNFYDNNVENQNSYTDSDTDNFNRIITVDSNLFPIYTAMKGDQDFPNIAMRNWSSAATSPYGGVGISPSKNDYMNRSVAAVGNYLNYTSYLYFGYGSKQAVKAVGIRTYMEWVYALDPANNNFRRYKFIKMADDIVPPLKDDGSLYGDIAPLDTSGTQINIGDCTTCDGCHWYTGDAYHILCTSNSSSETACCNSNNTVTPACSLDADGTDKDEIWAFTPKRPGLNCGGTNGGTSINYPSCKGDLMGGSTDQQGPMVQAGRDKLVASVDPSKGGAPSIQFPVMVSQQDVRKAGSGNVRVVFYFEAHKYDSSNGLAFILNKGGGTCEKTWVVQSQGNFDGTWEPTKTNSNIWDPANITFTPNPKDLTEHGKGPKVSDFAPPGNNADCTDCRVRGYVYFDISPTCTKTLNDQYKYATVDVYQCDKPAWVIRVPKVPQSVKDQAFRIPVTPMDTDPTAWAAITDPAQRTALIEKRWTNLDGYLDTVPPRSYPGYTSYNSGKWAPGYGSASNKTFNDASNVRFKDPRDIDAYRDYFDIQNGAPTYIFVADTGNSRIQVFMNATGVAGDVKARAPIRPVPVKGPNAAKANTNEIGFRAFPNMTGGDGRRGDWRNYTTLSGASFQPYTAGKGEFYFPHGVAVDQDPDSRDVYLFVADTYNHRIQVFRDISGVSSQPITNKNFDFRLAAMWGTYPMQNMTSMKVMTQPGAYNFRYPKGIDIARFKNNSSFLYVVDSKNYRVMRYLVGEDPAELDASGKVTDSGTGIPSNGIKADAGFGYDPTSTKDIKFSRRLVSIMGKPMIESSTQPGFLNPQDVATGYTGFYLYTAPFGKGTRFLNNYMVYVTDSARNNTTINPKLVSTRIMQFIDVPEGFSSITGAWITWETTRNAKFSTYTAARMKEGTAAAKYYNLKLGQTPFGLKGPNAFQLYSGGVYQSKGQWDGATFATNASEALGSTNNAGQAGYFTDRPFGIAALHWNTMKPIDIRVVDWSNPAESADLTATAWRSGEKLPRSTALRIGVASRYMSFGLPFDKRAGFKNSSTMANQIAGAWDAQFAGRVHIFCYDESGKFTNYTALYPQMAARREAPYNEAYRPSYLLPSGLAGIPPTNGCPSKGLVKIVAEDKDFPYSGRTGTAFYGIQ